MYLHPAIDNTIIYLFIMISPNSLPSAAAADDGDDSDSDSGLDSDSDPDLQADFLEHILLPTICQYVLPASARDLPCTGLDLRVA